MKPGVVLLIAGLAVGLSITSAAKAGSCPASEALFVEEKLQQLETWAQFSTFYSQHKKCDVSVGEDTNILSYADALTVSEWAVPAMQWANGVGLIQGSDNNLMPKGNATRAQAAAILHRFCETVTGE